MNCDPLAARKNKSRNSEPLEKWVPSVFVQECSNLKGIDACDVIIPRVINIFDNSLPRLFVFSFE